MEHGIHVTQNFLTATGCQTMDELMKLTTEQLIDAYLKAGAIDKTVFWDLPISHSWTA